MYNSYVKEPRDAFIEQVTSDNFAIKNKTRITSETHFKKSVSSALSAFDHLTIEKIVLSQSLEVEFEHPQPPLRMARHLMNKNPHAYTFAIPVANGHVLLGASPELLLSRQGNQVVSNPLAGSARRTNDEQLNSKNAENLQQSSKDNYEHRFVVDNIARNLAPHCCHLSISEQPHILETSSMLHLSSIFTGQLRQGAADALNLALDLHPTPAVCGTPTDLAKNFIIENENYDRHYYTGLVGWMDSKGNGEWVVTIRCGLLFDNRMTLYAGAGIVKGSDADAEWHETESKLQTILGAFSAN
ncbi:isochorismate synthase [Pseudoalteromonas sp.]|uniref:isochorismate synthase n=1 Tax=Pseudoalteromonas sp. TaxID=53249 RepID=UPI003F944F14